MTNAEIAKILRNVATSYTIKNEKKYKFQIIAYQKAADAISDSITEIKHLISTNRIDDLTGVGPSIKKSLIELVNTGRVKHFEAIFKDIPATVFRLMDIPGFGPKKSFKLVRQFNLDKPDTVIEELLKIAKSGSIADLEGFGDKSQAEIIKALLEFKSGVNKTSRMDLPYAQALADQIITYLKKSERVMEAISLGSLRRKKDTIGDIDIAVSTNAPYEVIDHFTTYPQKDRILEKGDMSAGIMIGGKHIDLMALNPEMFGSLLQHFTGSKNHNVHLREIALKMNLSLSEKGIKNLKSGKMNTYRTEESFYKALNMQWIPPEIREDSGEIELAQQNKLPKLVELDDIKGDFHLHSNYPIEPSHDLGQSSMEDMIKKAVKLNYEYIGFSEHNPSISKHTDSQTEKILAKRLEEINKMRLKYKKSIRIFSLLEVDIQPSGELAVQDRHTQYLDFLLVSVHSVFNMDKTKMTERIIKGLSHPKAKILTHPTGRLINQRLGYELDWDKLFKYCKDNHKILEINAYPTRLDLTDQMVKKAVEYGLYLTIDTDSHDVSHMDLMKYGVSVARRGWAKKHDILNTWEYNKIIQWLNK